ncbi:hypothetical protein [Alkalihalobacillus pseudalcaliphilus]|nr:hypothetical protein [Alkalihalobacillus pseudalcaliphilus]
MKEHKTTHFTYVEEGEKEVHEQVMDIYRQCEGEQMPSKSESGDENSFL